MKFLLLAAVLVAVAVTGCKSKPTATTRPTDAPGIDAAAPVPLAARLVVSPAALSVSPTSTQRAQAATFKLTLVVTNTTSRTYTGESPDAAVARFALIFEGAPLWSHPEFVPQVVTPVTLAPGQSLTYHAEVTLPDVRPFRGRLLEARSSFSPAALQTTTVIPVN
jgi:hypothetical protein